MEKLNSFFAKYKLHHIPTERLQLDSENPRLHERDMGKSEADLLKVMKDQFDLGELAYSLSSNGYFQEEPIIAIPNDAEMLNQLITDQTSPDEFVQIINDNDIYFTVVEGNRRLSTVKLLLSPEMKIPQKLGQ